LLCAGDAENAKQPEFHVELDFFTLSRVWCNFLGMEKAYKIETQLLVGFLARRVWGQYVL
jgi:hypothetical protein